MKKRGTKKKWKRKQQARWYTVIKPLLYYTTNNYINNNYIKDKWSKQTK